MDIFQFGKVGTLSEVGRASGAVEVGVCWGTPGPRGQTGLSVYST